VLVRVVVLGGTEFIGRRTVELLVSRGDDVLVVHRGVTEPAGWVDCAHLHADRAGFAGVAGHVAAFGPDAVVDSHALTAADVEAVLPHLPDTRLIVLSSMDVYRAYEHLRGRTEGEAVPLTEDAALRVGRYPYRGAGIGEDDYDKLHVEPPYLARGGTVLRLGFCYGEHDPQRREEFVLRRVRAGRQRIPFGAGTLLLSRLYVGDAASAVLATLGNPAAAGEVFNIAERRSRTVRGWAEQILAAAGSSAELVQVPDRLLPVDLRLTGAVGQHMLGSAEKAIAVLGWRPSSDPQETVGRSVAWHLAHPPNVVDSGFDDDDNVFAAADTGS